jgi:hypothetical protein
MRLAMSLASGMLLQLGGVAISLLTLRKARETYKMSNYRMAAVTAIAAVAVPLIFTGDVQQADATIPASLHAANQPIGVAKGIFPGRVVWVHDSTATNVNNDWMSSIFCSLDEVAIESVGYDFLRSEFTPARGLATYVQ